LVKKDPSSREYKSARVPKGGSATFEVRDREGRVIDALAEGDVLISVLTDAGELKTRLRGK